MQVSFWQEVPASLFNPVEKGQDSYLVLCSFLENSAVES